MYTADDLHKSLRELEADGENAPIIESIHEAVESAATLFNVAGCGVMFVDDAAVLHYATASDAHGRELEQAQVRAGTGPCVQALITNEVVQTTDVTTDERWTAIHDDLRETRVRAVLGIPVHVGGTVAGSLDAYCDKPHEWLESEIEGLQAYAKLIERLLLSALRAQRTEETVRQLEHALEHRVMIERAVGVLMERHGLDAVEAFERLRSTARSSRRRAAEIATDILSGAVN